MRDKCKAIDEHRSEHVAHLLRRPAATDGRCDVVAVLVDPLRSADNANASHYLRHAERERKEIAQRVVGSDETTTGRGTNGFTPVARRVEFHGSRVEGR